MLGDTGHARSTWCKTATPQRTDDIIRSVPQRTDNIIRSVPQMTDDIIRSVPQRTGDRGDRTITTRLLNMYIR